MMKNNRDKNQAARLPKSKERKVLPTSDWNQSADWYDELVGDRGHIHHEKTIIPGLKRMLKLESGMCLLDVACGQGVVCRAFARDGVRVTGVDLATDLIQLARQRMEFPQLERYYQGDARHLDAAIPAGESRFDAACCVLAITNMTPLSPVWESIGRLLKPQSALVVVMVHPCFRIPRASNWHFDAANNRQFRTVGQYLTSGKFAIEMHPGTAPAELTYTFHRPLQAYVNTMASAGFLIEHLEEWTSVKHPPKGCRYDALEQARKEIPLFLAIKARLIGPFEPQ